MGLRRFVARPVEAALGAIGYAITRRPEPPRPRDPPPLFEDPLEALHHHRGGKPAAFLCPLEQSRQAFGFSFSPLGWHPFVATLQEYAAGLAAAYQDSLLHTFYEAWQPATASEAIAGFAPHAPSSFERLPSLDAYLKPWISDSVEELRERFASWYRKDYAQYGVALDPAVHGDKFFGPVHPDLGEVEYRRLTGVFTSIRTGGYDRQRGDIRVEVLKRGPELRFLNAGGGMHRMASLAALGYEAVPAIFRRRRAALFDVADVDYWPNVRSGVWSRKAAIRYVDHLFDFDSTRWAAERGLLLEQQHENWPEAGIDVASRGRGTIVAGGEA